MSRSWLTSLPTAILVLFLLGFPCGSLMMYMQAPAQHCCGDCGDAPQTPPPGCRTLCAASSVTILLQSMDVTAGVPLDAGLLAQAPMDVLVPPGPAVEPGVPFSVGSPPLYLQHASLLI
jgi:hypothetical protein